MCYFRRSRPFVVRHDELGLDSPLQSSDEDAFACTFVVDTVLPREDEPDKFSVAKLQRPKILLDGACQSWKTGLYTDVTVIVDMQRFSAHRLVLASLSDYFPPLLKFDEKESGEVTLHNIEPDDFSVLLNYAYTGDVELTKGNVQSVLIASDYLNIGHAKEMCIQFMTANLDIDNICDVLLFATAYPLSELVENATKFLKEHLEEASKTDSFVQLDPTFLEKLFEDNNLILYSSKISLKSGEREKLIFNSVLRYLSKLSVSDPIVVEKLIRTVRLSQISRDVGAQCLKNFTTLKDNEIIRKYVGLQEVAVKLLQESGQDCSGTSRKNSESQEIPDTWFQIRKHPRFAISRKGMRYAIQGEIAYSPNDPYFLLNDYNVEIRRIEIWLRMWEDTTVIGGLSLLYRSCSDDNKNMINTKGNCPEAQCQHFVDLDAGEFITKVTVGSGYLINRLAFETNRGRTLGPFGGPGGREYTETPPAGSLSYLFNINCDSVNTHGSEAIFNMILRWITFA